jgi:hypothetical protein
VADDPLGFSVLSDSSDCVEDRSVTASKAPISSHLPRLLRLKGRSIYTLQGKEAAELGSKLHDARFRLLPPSVGSLQS